MTIDKTINTELEMIRQCCVCKDYGLLDYTDFWFNVDKATELTLKQHPITHTYCPSCLQDEYKKLNERR